MLYEIISEIADEINQHFQLRFGIAEEKLIVSNLVNNDGSLAVEKDNVVLSIVNIQEEKHIINKNFGGSRPVSLNLFLLFTTTFSGSMSGEGLKFLSEIVAFFQAENVYEIEGNKLIFELYNLDFGEQNNLWASLGAKYNPAVIYKVGLVTIDESMPPSTLSYSTDFPE